MASGWAPILLLISTLQWELTHLPQLGKSTWGHLDPLSDPLGPLTPEAPTHAQAAKNECTDCTQKCNLVYSALS